jgi:hypothetical protein
MPKTKRKRLKSKPSPDPLTSNVALAERLFYAGMMLGANLFYAGMKQASILHHRRWYSRCYHRHFHSVAPPKTRRRSDERLPEV